MKCPLSLENQFIYWVQLLFKVHSFWCHIHNPIGFLYVRFSHDHSYKTMFINDVDIFRYMSLTVATESVLRKLVKNLERFLVRKSQLVTISIYIFNEEMLPVNYCCFILLNLHFFVCLCIEPKSRTKMYFVGVRSWELNI